MGGQFACDETVLQPGEEGGECRIGPEPCVEDLACIDGSCQPKLDEEERPQLAIQFVIADRHMPADGVSNTPILIEANETESGDSFTGELLLFPSPAMAGRMDPPVVKFVSGLAQTAYVACRAGGVDDCPEYIFIYAAHPDRPLEPIARSPAIRLVDQTIEFMSVVQPNSCAAGEGKLAFRKDLSSTEEDLSLFSSADVQIQAEEGVLLIQSGRHELGLRFDAANTAVGIRELRTQDITVSPNPDLELPSPCDDPNGSQWSGYLQVMSAMVNDGNLAALEVFFEATCVVESGQTVSLRGCAHFNAQAE